MNATTFVRLARADATPWIFDTRIRLSLAEQIALAFFVYITLAAFVFHLAARDLGMIMTLNTVTLATLLALRRNRQRAPWLAAAADLFPAVLILTLYSSNDL